MTLPEDNPFTEQIKELRHNGMTNREVLQELNEVYDVVDRRAMEEARREVDAVAIEFSDQDGGTYVIEDHEEPIDVVERLDGSVGSVADWHETTTTIIE